MDTKIFTAVLLALVAFYFLERFALSKMKANGTVSTTAATEAW